MSQQNGLDPIDKIIIRVIISVLGAIFGWTAVKTSNDVGEIAKTYKASRTSHAGFGPALPQVQK